jgi:hypothetical protein
MAVERERGQLKRFLFFLGNIDMGARVDRMEADRQTHRNGHFEFCLKCIASDKAQSRS